MKSKGVMVGIICVFCLVLFLGCNYFRLFGYHGENEEIEYVIGVSQANMRESWRLALVSELEEEAGKHPDVRLIMMDASSDTEKQKKDVEKLLGFGIDLLIISPWDTEEMTPIISDVYKMEVPVIVMDRAVEGFDYSLFIGPDNELIGRQAGEGTVRMMEGQPGTVLEICMSKDSLPSQSRSKGFDSILSKYTNLKRETCRVDSGSKDDARDMLLEMGDALQDVDVIFAHNDYMALGARQALEQLNMDAKIMGIDGFTGENKGIDLVSREVIDETITCPTGGKEAIQYALSILNEESGVPKQIILRSHDVTRENVSSYLQSRKKTVIRPDRIIDIGYAQVGTESAWRRANTESIKAAAKDFGFNLIMEDANQLQANQIKAINKFIELKVDVIVVSPAVTDGWDEILEKAKEANIPVLLSDRQIEVENDELIMTYIGSDFLEEGRRAMNWIVKNVKPDKETMKIMELQGSEGASPTIQRKEGFEEILKENKEYQMVHSRYGDYTTEGGQQIIRDYLKENQWDIDIIFAHNDDMALGAIDELEKHGIKSGEDVKIVSVDGTKEAFEAMLDGTLNCVVECNPLLGPQLMKAIQDYMNGKELPLRIITGEQVFDQKIARESMLGRKY